VQPATWRPTPDRHILRGLSREERRSCKYVACIFLVDAVLQQLIAFCDFFYEGPLLERKSRITFSQDQGVQTLLNTICVTVEVYKRRIWH
jgi:hypothetical protein